MDNKILMYVGIVVVVLVLGFSILTSVGFMNGKVSDDLQNNDNSDLDKYRSNEIPEECRLPDYENSVQGWKEHLGHHQNTLYCLDYYK